MSIYDSISKYQTKNNYTKNDDIAEYIHFNLDKCDKEELEKMYLQITTKEKLEQECLMYELFNYVPKNKVSEIDELIKITINSLQKFQYKIGGFHLEDYDWICSDSLSNPRFKFKSSTCYKMLYNSVHEDKCGSELKWFMSSIVEYIKKFIFENTIKITYKIYEDRSNSLCWIMLIFSC